MAPTDGIALGDQQQHIILDGNFLPAVFRTQSYSIAKDAVRYVSRGADYDVAPNKIAVIMRSLVDDTIKDRADLMRHLVRTLDVKQREQLHLVRDIANKMFDDEQVNWGRIVTLHAFCGCLAKHLEETIIADCADDIAQILGDFVVNRLGLWIVAHGGWRAFEAQFPAVCVWVTSGFWKGIAILALMIGAVLAFYSSVRFMSGNTVS